MPRITRTPIASRDLRHRPVFCEETRRVYKTHAEACRQLGVYASTISLVVHGRLKTTGGYRFRIPTPAELRKAGLA